MCVFFPQNDEILEFCCVGEWAFAPDPKYVAHVASRPPHWTGSGDISTLEGGRGTGQKSGGRVARESERDYLPQLTL